MERRWLGFHGILWDFMGLLIFWVDLDSFLLGVRDGTCWDLAIFSWIGWFLGGGLGYNFVWIGVRSNLYGWV